MTNKNSSTCEKRLSKFFGLNEKTWLNHANSRSVYSRFFIPLLLVIAIWSRKWIGINVGYQLF